MAHLKNYRVQMLMSGGSYAVRYKMFVGTLAGATLDWFVGLIDKMIISFDVLSHLFVSQFAANKERPLTIADMFDMWQAAGELLKLSQQI